MQVILIGFEFERKQNKLQKNPNKKSTSKQNHHPKRIWKITPEWSHLLLTLDHITNKDMHVRRTSSAPSAEGLSFRSQLVFLTRECRKQRWQVWQIIWNIYVKIIPDSWQVPFIKLGGCDGPRGKAEGRATPHQAVHWDLTSLISSCLFLFFRGALIPAYTQEICCSLLRSRVCSGQHHGQWQRSKRGRTSCWKSLSSSEHVEWDRGDSLNASTVHVHIPEY